MGKWGRNMGMGEVTWESLKWGRNMGMGESDMGKGGRNMGMGKVTWERGVGTWDWGK